MKKSNLALVVMGIVASVSVQAAEIYNKDGNKLDVNRKVFNLRLLKIYYRLIMFLKCGNLLNL